MIRLGTSPAPTRANLADEIHVWTARPEEFRSEAALTRYRGWLSDEERVRADRYLRADDRHLFLIAHALLRYALTQYGDEPPGAWQFTTQEYGRPQLASAPRLGFSLSHTPGLVACVVSDELDCGVDVEGLGRVADPRGLARRYFSSVENAVLDLVRDDEVDARFVELWTLKEAYVKARGLGLELPLDRFACARGGGGDISATFDAPIEDRPEEWQFAQIRPTSQHVLALAVRHGSGGERRVVMRRTGERAEGS